ncbi:BCCT family transporter [Vreelandella arcis]|uniref:Betaine/carnitine transporter, BCCT family n=1 Tax=Vreelandella arcis TaxID=416873 RepID=A0A1G9XPY3_9GAMM|nr:BCCT family transporter [Halomonas arcis]SDM98770.1 betaine/carnitine transporter, BCCT family [Halomonas arcis]
MLHQKIRKEIAGLDLAVFMPALVLTLVLAVVFSFWPEGSGELLDKAHAFTTNELGWFFLLATVGAMSFCLYLAMSRYGKVVLGDRDTRPEFSTLTWLGMTFTSGTGGSLLYLSAAEWIWIMQSPPFGAEPGSAEAARWASAFGMFHWGPSAWAWYIACAVPIGYAMYVRKQRNLKLSELTRPVLGRWADGLIGHAINFLYMFGIIGGVMTSIALGTPLISSTFAYAFGMEAGNPVLDIFVIFLWTFIPMMALILGLQKGVARLSNFNVRLDIALLAGVLVCGPLSFTLNQSVDGLGLMLQNFVYMSLATDVIRDTGFPQAWTIFYFSWWVVYALPYGLFIAKISRGRTIRGVVFAGLVAGSLGCMVFYMVFPAFGIHLQTTGQLDLIAVMNDAGRGEVVRVMLEQLPAAGLFIVVFGLVALLSYVSGQCAVGYSLASATQKTLLPEQEASRYNASFWLVLVGMVSMALYFLNPESLTPLQTISILTGFPLCFVIAIVGRSFMLMLDQDLFNESAVRDIGGRKYLTPATVGVKSPGNGPTTQTDLG